jgi:hypothetical protein
LFFGGGVFAGAAFAGGALKARVVIADFLSCNPWVLRSDIGYGRSGAR